MLVKVIIKFSKAVLYFVLQYINLKLYDYVNMLLIIHIACNIYLETTLNPRKNYSKR